MDTLPTKAVKTLMRRVGLTGQRQAQGRHLGGAQVVFAPGAAQAVA